MISNLDLTAATAVVTAANAVISLMAMQVVTREAGFKTGRHRLQFCQRLALATLTLALGYDFYDTVATGSDPRLGDLIVHVALLGVLSCWAYRKYFMDNLLQAARHNPKPFTVFDNTKITGKLKIDH